MSHNYISISKDLKTYTKDPYKAKYQLLINKGKSIDVKRYNDPKAFMEYYDNMGDIYTNNN